MFGHAGAFLVLGGKSGGAGMIADVGVGIEYVAPAGFTFGCELGPSVINSLSSSKSPRFALGTQILLGRRF